MFLFILPRCPSCGAALGFKYISCSYLSDCPVWQSNVCIVFKYISCSYLSIIPIFHSQTSAHSNTSHVLIYLVRPYRRRTHKIIQIHLMFLFIGATHILMYLESSFKYISCSYLSFNLSTCNISIFIQIHLMFLFIESLSQDNFSYLHIQIHLMFLFIR